MAIARQLAELMNGQITVQSTEGKGSVFSVTLSLRKAREASLAAEPDDSMSSPVTELGEIRILAAEDNATNQLVLKTLLQQAGLHVTMVEDGAAAVAAWEREAWDIILMDVHMPEMDGVTATRWIRDRERKLGRPAIPIIALTANAMSHQIAEYVAAGMSGHVAKPIQIEKLFEALMLAFPVSEPDDRTVLPVETVLTARQRA